MALRTLDQVDHVQLRLRLTIAGDGAKGGVQLVEALLDAPAQVGFEMVKMTHQTFPTGLGIAVEQKRDDLPASITVGRGQGLGKGAIDPRMAQVSDQSEDSGSSRQGRLLNHWFRGGATSPGPFRLSAERGAGLHPAQHVNFFHNPDVNDGLNA